MNGVLTHALEEHMCIDRYLYTLLSVTSGFLKL